MTAPLLRSRFKNVYLGIGAFWLATSLALAVLTNEVIVPKLIKQRALQLEALAISQQMQLLYNDNRTLRDELLRENMIGIDQDFEEIRSASESDRDHLSILLRDCKWITEKVCSGPKRAIFVSEARSTNPSFALVLETSYFNSIPGVFFYKFLVSFGLFGLFSLVVFAIRQQEKFFVGKIEFLTTSLNEIENSFRSEGLDSAQEVGPPIDEFTSISLGLKKAKELIANKSKEIERYKKDFERKTRLEQLTQTFSYTSHNVKAPLLEGADFLTDLPDFIETMPKEKLLRNIESLANRFRKGADALQSAVQLTRESQLRPEPLELGPTLHDFKMEIENNSQLRDVQIELDVSGANDARVFFSSQEMNAVLWNLLLNSIEARQDAKIMISAQVENRSASIQFRDNGPGIPELLLGKVFDEYFTTKSKGSGVGLPGVKRTIERGLGSIRAVPSSSGARFEITLPLHSPGMGATHG